MERNSSNNKSKHHNFWIDKKLAEGCTNVALGVLLGKDQSTISAYFVGKSMPKDDAIQTLCEYFDVDFNLGKAKFQEAFDQWTEDHKDTYVAKGDSHQLIAFDWKKYKRPKAKKVKAVKSKESKNPLGNHAKADNFWRALRIEQGLSYEEISANTDIPSPMCQQYFSGQCLPSTDRAYAICDYMGVGHDVGVAKFAEIHQKWREDHTKLSIIKVPEKLDPIESPQISQPVASTSESCVAHTIGNLDDALEYLYGKVAYDEFEHLLTLKTVDDVLKALYGKVDYNLYVELIGEIQRSNEPAF